MRLRLKSAQTCDNPRMPNSLFDLHASYASLCKAGDPLERDNAVIDGETFHAVLSGIDSGERNSPAC